MLANTSDRELVFTRLFNAPVGLVFEVWTNPAHLPHWWGPNGFTTTIHSMDLRPGGVWRLTMHGPDGRDYHNRLVFIEVDKPHRLVYKHEPEPGSEPVNFEVTVTFENDNGKTHLTMRMVFPTIESRDYVVNIHHADEGGRQTLARLAEHLEHLAEANEHFLITRTFNAPREVVFKAWTDPEHLSEWWGPEGFTSPVCEVDVRPGGKIFIQMRSPDGVEYPLHGRFLEVIEPERLVFVHRSVRHAGNEADGRPPFEIRNTVTFFDAGPGKTELRLDVDVVSATDAARLSLSDAETRAFRQQTRVGWTQMFDRLAGLVEARSGGNDV